MVLAVEPVEKIVPIRTLVLVGRIFQPQSCTPGMKRRQEHNFSQGGELCVVWSSCRGGVVVRSSLWQMCLGSWCLPSGVARGVLSNRIATGVCGIAPAAPPGSRAGGVPRSSTRLWQMCLRPWGLPRGVARGVLSNRITTGVRGTAPSAPFRLTSRGVPRARRACDKGLAGGYGRGLVAGASRFACHRC